jgi:hypothetical protein
MRRHTFDPVSFVFGALFAAIGLTFLFGNADIGDLHLGAIWPLPLILIGVLMLVSTIQRRQREEPVPVPAPMATSAPASTVPMPPAATTEIEGLDDVDTRQTDQEWPGETEREGD